MKVGESIEGPQTDSGQASPVTKPEEKYLSVVLGCYNAASQVEKNVDGLTRFLDTLGKSYELIVVDDGSLDNSFAILRGLEKTLTSLVVLRNPQNMGKGFSIRNGILNSTGKYVIFTDLDMAYSRENLVTMLKKLEEGDQVVVANRRLPESIYTVNNKLIRYVYRRHRFGVAFNMLVRYLFGFETRDTQSGLKGFHRGVAFRIFDRIRTRGFLFDVEIFILAKKLGLKIREIPVQIEYTTDETTVQQFREFFKLAPQLMRIKLLEMRGAYEASPGTRERQLAKESPQGPGTRDACD